MTNAVIERLYRAHFSEQRSIFDMESLVALGVEAGLDGAEARRTLESDAYSDAVRADVHLGERGEQPTTVSGWRRHTRRRRTLRKTMPIVRRERL